MESRIDNRPASLRPPWVRVKVPVVRFVLAAAAILALLAAPTAWVYAQVGGNFDLSWSTIDGGGGTSTGSTFNLKDTIGQPDAGAQSGGSFSIEGGFWSSGPSMPTNTPTNTPTSTPTVTLTRTRTPSPTATPTNPSTQTPTSTPPSTPSSTPSSVRTGTATATTPATASATQTSTPASTYTDTATPTATSVPQTGTATTTPTDTATNVPTNTPTNTQTSIPGATFTNTPVNSPTYTSTATQTNVATGVPTGTATGTVTSTATSTRTPTPVGTPCSTCNVYFTDADVSCNTDGTVHWTFTVRNNGTCDVTVPVKIRLQTRRGYSGRFVGVETITQILTFPPGLTTREGDICHVFSPTESFMNLYVRVNPACRGGHADYLSSYVDVCTPNPTCPSGPSFSDLSLDSPFWSAIHGMVQAGLVSGYSDGTFRPGNPATRGQVAKMLSTTFELPAAGGTQHFNDVPPTHPFYSYIEAAYNAGLISGYSDGTFRPGSPITRGQIAKMAVEAVEQTQQAGWISTLPSTPTFSDVPAGSAFFRYVETAYANGVIGGYSDHTFHPSAPATRGQIAQIIMLAVTPQQPTNP